MLVRVALNDASEAASRECGLPVTFVRRPDRFCGTDAKAG